MIGLSDTAFKFGTTVVLAYPDATRLAGYRAALGLWQHLSSGGNSAQSTTASFEAKVDEVLESSDLGGLALPVASGQEQKATSIGILLTTPQSTPDLSFCFVTGAPEQSRIPELADTLLGLFETHGVSRLIVAAAANLSGVRNDEQLWAQYPVGSSGEGSGAFSDVFSSLSRLEAPGVKTSDAFLSVLSNLLPVSGLSDAVLLVHGDKRPAGSSSRQRIVFGSDYADEGDAAVVEALAGALAVAVQTQDTDAAAAAAKSNALDVEVLRMRLDVDSAAKGLPAFG
ncbi:hypothetical protein GGI07_002145 [Coemansia sp. Benny D115]|nr:hypothetical protein GGI07_002145 [Coemansia sp. Benny D115]